MTVYLAHRFADRIKEDSDGVLYQMPTIRDLYREARPLLPLLVNRVLIVDALDHSDCAAGACSYVS